MHWKIRTAGTASLVFAASLCAFSQRFPIAVSQYAHTSWSVRDGFTQDSISAVVQTPDGYLWLGTGSGLYRFDGVSNLPWKRVNDQLHGANILSLLAAQDGTLWIGSSEGLASWKDGRLFKWPQFADTPVYAVLEAKDGTVWAGGGAGAAKLCTIKVRNLKCFAEDKGLGSWITALHQDHAGNIWVAGMGVKGLWRWSPGPPAFFPLPVPQYIRGIEDGEHGELLVASTGSGIQQIVQGETSAFPVPNGKEPLKPRYLLRDREGALWIGTTGQGLVHFSHGHVDTFSTAKGLSGDLVEGLFQDREGDIWVATIDGLDRFRHFAISTISAKQGLSSSTIMAVLSAKDGSMWFSSPDGLNHWQDGNNTIYRDLGGNGDNGTGSLYEDSTHRIWASTAGNVGYFQDGRFTPIANLPGRFVSVITGDTKGNIWLSDLNSGLVHLVNDKRVEQWSWDQLKHKDDASSLLIDPLRGGLWLGFSGNGVEYFSDGQVQESYGEHQGLTGAVTSLYFDHQGALWAATDDGLVRIQDHRATVLTEKNGLPCDAAQQTGEDDDHNTWVYMACGLLRIPNSELDAWAAGKKQKIQFTSFDTSDGLRTHTNTSAYSPGFAKSPDGSLWFLPFDGVSVIDPRNLYANPLPPPVYVERVTADEQVFGASSKLALPPLVHDLKIDYTALSLVAPEKILFRYKLEGYDKRWTAATNRRQAFYSNLPPGNYKFHVIACNNSGVWNQTGAMLPFSIAAAYYQTNWFRALCLLSGVALIWLIMELRIRTVENHHHERRQAAEALRKVEAELAHVSRVTTMGELTASLAHEINQPIAAAILNANTCKRWLSREPLDLAEARDAASRVVKDATRAADTITRVRQLFKKNAPQEELIDLNELVREMLDLVQDEVARNSVLVRTELADDLPRVWGDRVQIQQVLMNLIMNAMDAMKNVRTARELFLKTEKFEHEEILVSVRDAGVGIPPEHADSIFDAFFTTKTTGTGLGLRISRSIIELHGGRLWAANNTPRGAVFSFTLPAISEARK
jgi:signal transduction histidine kinase/ligand-binding sensor domain-containing protein